MKWSSLTTKKVNEERKLAKIGSGTSIKGIRGQLGLEQVLTYEGRPKEFQRSGSTDPGKPKTQKKRTLVTDVFDCITSRLNVFF